MYNLRYHIASLVAVFLALAIGLVLGGLAVGGGMLDRQQSAMVKGLQDEFATLREQNHTLTSENKVLNSFSGDVIDNWASGRLAGRTTVVITRDGLNDAVDAVRKPVKKAGGSVVTVTLVEPRLGLDSEKAGPTMASLVATATDPVAAVASALLREWATPGSARPVTEGLVDAGVLRVDGMKADPGQLCLVLLAGKDGNADVGGLALLRAAEGADAAVGAEMGDSGTGVAAAAKDAGAAGMDMLGTPVGEYTLISLLSTKATGYFGSAAGARALYPEVTLP